MSAGAAETMLPSAPPAVCAACGSDPRSSLACLQCGAVLAEADGATHFQRLAAAPAITLDAAALERNYLRLSRLLHPDFHGGSGGRAADLAVRNSALLNEAWSVLTDEQERAEYLLSLHDPQALERHKQLAPAFLMEAMELSETVEEAAARRDLAAVTRVAGDVRQRMAERRSALAEPAAWSPPDTRRLATLLHELRVFARILRDSEQAA